MKHTLTVALVTSCMITSTAMAEGTYIGADYHIGTYDRSSASTSVPIRVKDLSIDVPIPSEWKPRGIKIKAGKYITENIAIEGHLSFGIGSNSVTSTVPITRTGDGVIGYLDSDHSIEIKNAVSIFVKGDLPISESANLYGLLGFTKGKLEVKYKASVSGTDITSSAASTEDSGLSYGIGAEVRIGNGLYVSGEYILYLSEATYDYTGFNIGLHKRF